MNRGVIYKAFRETCLSTILLSIALFAIEAILAFVLPTLETQFRNMLTQLPFVQTIIKALLGTDIGAGFGAEGIQSIAWVHPVVLALVWGHAIVICTRVPAGEVDRGTADVLFSMPISRWRIHVSETVMWLIALFVLVLLGWIGHECGTMLAANATHVVLMRQLIVITNLFCVALAVGSTAWLVSSLSQRRGSAIAVVFALVLASFLLNFLGQFWEPAQRITFLGILNYYRPYEIIRNGTFPIRDVSVLFASAAATWTLAGFMMSKRDIVTT